MLTGTTPLSLEKCKGAETRTPAEQFTLAKRITPSAFIEQHSDHEDLAHLIVDSLTLIVQCQRMPEAPSPATRDHLSHSLYCFQGVLPEASLDIFQVELEFTLLPRLLTLDQQHNKDRIYSPCITFILVASHRAGIPWPDLCAVLAYIETHTEELTSSTDKMC